MKIALALIVAATQALKLESNFKAPESGELDLQETVNALNFVGDETVELYDDTDLESEIEENALECRPTTLPIGSGFGSSNSNFGNGLNLNFGNTGIGSGFRVGNSQTDLCSCISDCFDNGNGNGSFPPGGVGGALDCDCPQINADIASL